MSQPDATRQRAEQSCCAHMTVYYRTHTDQGTSLTTGWWECSTCLTRFVPGKVGFTAGAEAQREADAQVAENRAKGCGVVDEYEQGMEAERRHCAEAIRTAPLVTEPPR